MNCFYSVLQLLIAIPCHHSTFHIIKYVDIANISAFLDISALDSELPPVFTIFSIDLIVNFTQKFHVNGTEFVLLLRFIKSSVVTIFEEFRFSTHDG